VITSGRLTADETEDEAALRHRIRRHKGLPRLGKCRTTFPH
jgi:hypothetical protein